MADLYANGSLTIPRVKVVWGPEDITANVYDVRVSLDEQGQTPTGSMKWIPTPNYYAKYIEWITKYKEWSIMITFYYIGGGNITFEFYWAGQSENYGNEMEITVKLVSFLDGLVNANFFASAQTDVGEKGIKYSEAASKMLKQFGITGVTRADGQPLDILRYTAQARKDTEKAIVKFNYNDGATFSDAVQNLVKDNGNNVFFNNIGTANAVIFTPYSWETYESIESAIEPGWARRGNPDPTKRYGYFIGPGIIQTFTRTYEWQPPQKSQEITAMMNRKAEELKAARRAQRGNRGNRNGRAGTNAQQSAAAATATSGVYGSNTSQNIRSENNEDGPEKQDIFTKERAAKLSLSVLMCPALTGIKPLDIIFIPSYNEEFIEDWVVSSVEYQQNDKGVDLSIQATRPVGQGEPMSPKNSERYLDGYADQYGLSKSTSIKGDKLVNWVNFAWFKPLAGTRLIEGIPQTVSTPSDNNTRYQDATPSEVRDKILEDYPLLDPSKAFTVKPNFDNIKSPGGFLNRNVYIINDELFLLYLKSNPVLTGSGLDIVTEKFINDKGKITYGITGKVSLKDLQGIYSQFSTVRVQFADRLAEVNYNRPAGTSAVIPPSAPESPLKAKPKPVPESSGQPSVTNGATQTGATGTSATSPAGTTSGATNASAQGATGVTGTTPSAPGDVNTPATTSGAAPVQPSPQPVQDIPKTGGLSIPLVKEILKGYYIPNPTTAVRAILPSGGNSGVQVDDLLFSDFLILKNKEGGINGVLSVDDSAKLLNPKGYSSLVITGGNLNEIRKLYVSQEYRNYLDRVGNFQTLF